MGCPLHRSLDVSYWNIGHELSDPGSLEIKVSGIRICGWLRTDCVVVMKGGNRERGSCYRDGGFNQGSYSGGGGGGQTPDLF